MFESGAYDNVCFLCNKMLFTKFIPTGVVQLSGNTTVPFILPIANNDCGLGR